MKDIISKRRKELGLTQKELADKLFISDKVISKWETGKSIPDTAILVDLAKALDLSLDELLNVKDKKQDSNDSSLKGMLKAKYNNISIIALSLQLITTILFWTSNGIYEEVNQGGSDVMVAIYFLTMLLSIMLFIGSISYFAVATNKIKAKYARFIKLDSFYFNLFVIVTAVFVNLDALSVVYYNGFYGNELFLFSAITTVIVASISALIIWLKHFINKKRN